MQSLLKKNVSGLPLCFKSLKTQACLRQHLPSTPDDLRQLWMLRLNMGECFDEQNSEVTTRGWEWVHLPRPAYSPQTKIHSPLKVENPKCSLGPWRSWKMTSVSSQMPKPLLLWRWQGHGSSQNRVCAGKIVRDGQCTLIPPGEALRMLPDNDQQSLRRGINSENQVPKCSQESLSLLNIQIPCTPPL